jgi:transketolase
MNVIRTSEQRNVEMSKVYQETLLELLETNEEVVICDADLVGAIGLSGVYEKHKDRCINMGICEANMMGAAAGMSLTGKIPFIHSLAPFAIRRLFDQLYLSGAYQKANVRIFGSDPGFWAAYNGGTHTSVEDLALARVIPDVTVLAPADAVQFQWILREIAGQYGMFYIRAGRHRKLLDIYAPGSTFEIGKGVVLAEGNDVAIFAIGEMIREALEAKEILEKNSISVSVIDMFTIKPLDRELVKKAIEGKKVVVTAENHSIIGGLGSAIAEVMAENGSLALLSRIGIQDHFGEVGTPEYLQEKFKLKANDIVHLVMKQMERKS